MIIKNQIKWFKRDIGYMFWMFSEQVITMALPRLILFPLAAYYIGKEEFGVFVTAMSVTLILGTQPQNGLATGLLRHLADYPHQQRKQFCGTSVRMCHKAMFTIVAIGVLGAILVGSLGFAPWRILKCIIPLTISLYPENQFMLILTENRFDRQFRQRTMWSVVRSMSILAFGFVGTMVGKSVGLSWGYMIGNVVAYIMLCLRSKVLYQTPYSVEMAGVLKSVWLQVTLAGIIAISGPYLNRLVLSGFYSYGDVADLVVATSVLYLFLAPVACSGFLLLSMISKYASIKQFSSRGKVMWLAMLLCGILVLPVIAKLMGPFILQLIYPKFGGTSLKLFSMLTIAIAGQSVISLVRPFVVKFASIRLLPIINGISMVSSLVATFLLIPKYGATGAAWAIIAGIAVTATAWSIAAIRVFWGEKN